MQIGVYMCCMPLGATEELQSWMSEEKLSSNQDDSETTSGEVIVAIEDKMPVTTESVLLCRQDFLQGCLQFTFGVHWREFLSLEQSKEVEVSPENRPGSALVLLFVVFFLFSFSSYFNLFTSQARVSALQCREIW